MSTSKDTLSYFLECLEGIPELYAKAMFGEYGIYSGEKMFALACDNTLFFKTYPETVSYFSDTTTKAYPGSRNTAPANPDWLESEKEELIRVAKLTIELAPITKSKKTRC
ncbi:TfoX/Sxy family protein [Candidatus Gracilibacteria bacterium]|nr:TfoX/Sxy family protein [Candidatus Gracilibacteria bacterium]